MQEKIDVKTKTFFYLIEFKLKVLFIMHSYLHLENLCNNLYHWQT